MCVLMSMCMRVCACVCVYACRLVASYFEIFIISLKESLGVVEGDLGGFNEGLQAAVLGMNWPSSPTAWVVASCE